MNYLIVIAGLVAVASAKDLIVGHEGGSIIFSQNVTASPAIWRQTRNLTVNSTEHEVITRVVVIDNREDKNGEAAIVEGGEGHKTVTIELKSPAVFRGYDFEVQVYAKHEDVAQKPVDNEQQIPQGALSPDTFVNENQKPKQDSELETPLPTVDSTQQVAHTQGEAQAPKNEVPQVPVTSVDTTQVSQGQHEVQIAKEGQDTVDQQATQETQQSNGQQDVQHPGASVHDNNAPVRPVRPVRPVWETLEDIRAAPKGLKQ